MPYRPKYKDSSGNLVDLPIEAETAVKLKTSRTIGLSGVTATAKSFNGSASITIPITSVPASLISGTLANNTTGNAATATALQGQRTINLSGVTASARIFDGTENITIPVTEVPASLLTGDVHAKTAENAVLENDGTYSGITADANGYVSNGTRIVKTKVPHYITTIGTYYEDYTILSGDKFPTPGKSYEVIYEDGGCKKVYQIVFPPKGSYSYVYIYFSLMFGVGSYEYDYQIKTSSTQTYKVIRWKIDHTNSKVMQTKLSAGSCTASSPYFKGIYELKEAFGA